MSNRGAETVARVAERKRPVWPATRAILLLLPSLALAESQLGSVSIAGSAAVTGPVTNAELRASAVPVSIPTPLPVTGSFWQATQPVSVAASVPVTGTFWQSTQPVSGTFWPATQLVSGTVTANAGTGTMAVSGPITDTQLRATPVPVSGTFYQATQPVSGTVTANVGTTNGLALDATLTGGSQKTKLIDSAGTNVATVSAAGAVKVDGSAVTQPVSGTFFQATQPVSGTFWQATQPVSGTVTANAGTGSFTVAQATASNLNATVTGTVAATQSGTWTVQPGNVVNTTAWLVSPGTRWSCTLTALAASLTQCLAAPAAGLKAYVTDIVVGTTTTTAGTYQVKYGTGTNCATGPTNLTGWAALAPISTAQPQVLSLNSPLVPVAANAICVIGTATNTINITLTGFTAP